MTSAAHRDIICNVLWPLHKLAVSGETTLRYRNGPTLCENMDLLREEPNHVCETLHACESHNVLQRLHEIKGTAAFVFRGDATIRSPLNHNQRATWNAILRNEVKYWEALALWTARATNG